MGKQIRAKRPPLVSFTPIYLRTKGAIQKIGCEWLFNQLVECGELKPFIKKPNFNLYRYIDVITACDRLESGKTTIPLIKEAGAATSRLKKLK